MILALGSAKSSLREFGTKDLAPYYRKEVTYCCALITVIPNPLLLAFTISNSLGVKRDKFTSIERSSAPDVEKSTISDLRNIHQQQKAGPELVSIFVNKDFTTLRRLQTISHRSRKIRNHQGINYLPAASPHLPPPSSIPTAHRNLCARLFYFHLHPIPILRRRLNPTLHSAQCLQQIH